MAYFVADGSAASPAGSRSPGNDAWVGSPPECAEVKVLVDANEFATFEQVEGLAGPFVLVFGLAWQVSLAALPGREGYHRRFLDAFACWAVTASPTVAVPRAQPQLFGPVASDPVVSQLGRTPQAPPHAT